MQKAVFSLLPSLAPAELPQLWPDLIQLLLNLLRPHQLEAQGSAAQHEQQVRSPLQTPTRKYLALGL